LNHILHAACTEYGLDVDLDRLAPLPYTIHSQAADTVVFVPGATSSSKRWPTKNWLALKRDLAARGISVIVLGQPHLSESVADLAAGGIKWVPTASVCDLVNAVSSALLVVSVDTGLMHLAVHQGTPTIALFNHQSIWFRPYPNCFPVFAKPCQSECKQRFLAIEKQWAQNPSQDSDCYQGWSGQDYLPCSTPDAPECMSSIDPGNVVELIERDTLLN